MYEVNEQGELRRPNGYIFGRLILVEVTIVFVVLLVVAVAQLSRDIRTDYPPLVQGLFAVSTGVIVLSSAVLLAGMRLGSLRKLVGKSLLLVAGLGAVFTLLQVLGFAELFAELSRLHALQEELGPAALDAEGRPLTRFSNVHLLYGVSGIHALHVLGGLVMLFRAWRSEAKGTEPGRALLRRRLVAPYWHLVTLVWVVFYVLL